MFYKYTTTTTSTCTGKNNSGRAAHTRTVLIKLAEQFGKATGAACDRLTRQSPVALEYNTSVYRELLDNATFDLTDVNDYLRVDNNGLTGMNVPSRAYKQFINTRTSYVVLTTTLRTRTRFTMNISQCTEELSPENYRQQM